MRLTRVDHVELTRHQRLQGDEGAALVEMTLVALFLMFLLFGIVMFGFLMSFRQNLTQAAAEGARAGAVAPFDAAYIGAKSAAQLGTNNAIEQFLAGGCGHSGMSCVYDISAPQVPGGPPCESSTKGCITVTVTFSSIQGPGGLLPSIPLVGQFLPNQIKAKASAAIYTS